MRLLPLCESRGISHSQLFYYSSTPSYYATKTHDAPTVTYAKPITTNTALDPCPSTSKETLQRIKTVSRANTRNIIFVDSGGESAYGSSLALAVSILSHIADEFSFSYSAYHKNKILDDDLLDHITPGDVVAFTSTSPEHHKTQELIKKIKDGFSNKVLIIKGGTHETIDGNRLQGFKSYPVDISFLGQADVSFKKFLEVFLAARFMDLEQIYKELSAIEGIAFKGKNTPVFVQNLGADLHVLPEMNHLELSEPFSIFGKTNPDSLMLRVADTRGCPYHCTFCAIQNTSSRLGAKKLVAYIRQIIENKIDIDRQRIEFVFFESGTFLTDKKYDRGFIGLYKRKDWIDEFVKEMKALNESFYKRYGFTIKFAFQTRTDTIEKEIIKKLKDVGLVSVYLGIETFDNKALMAMGKGTSCVDSFKALEILKSLGIKASCSTMVEPGKEDEIKDAVQKLMELEVHEIFTEYRAVYPGTPDAHRIKIDNRPYNCTIQIPHDLSDFYVIDAYDTGQTHKNSRNPEDRGKLIVKGDKGLEIVNEASFVHLQEKFYTEVKDIAARCGYVTEIDGHYIKHRYTKTKRILHKVSEKLNKAVDSIAYMSLHPIFGAFAINFTGKRS